MKFIRPTGWLALLVVACATFACAPSPKNVPCSNNSDCAHAGDGYEYCLEGRCVKCISKSMCAPDEMCVDGECQKRSE